jgi:hypothetical protein
VRLCELVVSMRIGKVSPHRSCRDWLPCVRPWTRLIGDRNVEAGAFEAYWRGAGVSIYLIFLIQPLAYNNHIAGRARRLQRSSKHQHISQHVLGKVETYRTTHRITSHHKHRHRHILQTLFDKHFQRQKHMGTWRYFGII